MIAYDIECVLKAGSQGVLGRYSLHRQELLGPRAIQT